jgi:hypothetical protein
MTLCAFTTKDRVQADTNGIKFKRADASETLSISFAAGTIEYKSSAEDTFPTENPKGVPDEKRVIALTKDLLPKLAVSLSEVSRRQDGADLDLYVTGSGGMYFPGNKAVSILEWRGVNFRRAVDGILVSGGDGGDIHFGERERISRISISWHALEPVRRCQAKTVDEIVQGLRESKAFCAPLPEYGGRVNWSAVKSIAVRKARPCYCAGNSDLLYPFLALSVTVTAENGPVNVEIDCPMIVEQ